MADDTRGWFFATTTTERPNGTKIRELRAGGRPAMVLAIGTVLVVVYLVYMFLANPSRWEAAGGAMVVLATFAGLFVYLMKLEYRTGGARRTDDVE